MESSTSSVISDAINDYFSEVYALIELLIRRFCTNFYKSFAEVTAYRWTKVGLSVIGYLIIRPYIEAFFKKMHDRDRKKQQEKERAEKEKGKKAKVSPNALRGGSEGEGKVLGEVDNTDDELDGENAEEFATASGVPEWGKNARKRAKKNQKKLEREATGTKSSNMTEEEVMELLDWSDSEDEKKA
ncbi:trafficking PGA2-domain-containing protein [Aspergillus cavernicola]|uniref:Trafficking PGA2-domain-containing protein n=1 Tax=Aspergillus cavernicola TaxID=176166 RepID=A0ABR4III3_9EURO